MPGGVPGGQPASDRFTPCLCPVTSGKGVIVAPALESCRGASSHRRWETGQTRVWLDFQASQVPCSAAPLPPGGPAWHVCRVLGSRAPSVVGGRQHGLQGWGQCRRCWAGREMDRWTREPSIRRSPYCITPSSHRTPVLRDPRAHQWPGRALVHHPLGREGGRAWTLGSSQPWPRTPPDPGQRTHTSKAVTSSQASPAGPGDQGLPRLEAHVCPHLTPSRPVS